MAEFSLFANTTASVKVDSNLLETQHPLPPDPGNPGFGVTYFVLALCAFLQVLRPKQ